MPLLSFTKNLNPPLRKFEREESILDLARELEWAAEDISSDTNIDPLASWAALLESVMISIITTTGKD